MASKSTGQEDAVRNFEEWRKNKASTSTTAAQTETSASSVDEEIRAEKNSKPTEVESTRSAFFAKAGATVSSFAKSVVARIGLLFARKEKTESIRVETIVAEETSTDVADAGEVVAKKTKAAKKEAVTSETTTEPETPSLWAKVSGSLAGLRSKVTGASPRAKKITLASIVAGAVVVIFIVLFAKFEFVTVDSGIETTVGDAQGSTFLIEKADAALQNDLVVAVQPGAIEGEAEPLMVGTVFSFNDETYALYDGEVIWQIPLSALKGKVLFATATQLIP